MSSRNAIQGPSYLDPLFPIPEGLVDYQHSNVPGSATPDYFTEEGDGTEEWTDEEIATEDYEFDDGDGEVLDDLGIPDSITIVDQIIRTLPSGMQVVDVIIDVEDVPGAVNYDFRIVKM